MLFTFSNTASQGSLQRPFIFLHATAAQSLPGLNAPDLICTWKPWPWLVLDHSGILDITHNPKQSKLSEHQTIDIKYTSRGKKSKSKTVTTDNVA